MAAALGLLACSSRSARPPEQPMFTTDLVNLCNRNILKTSLYIYIFQDKKCRLMRNLSLSMVKIIPQSKPGPIYPNITQLG